MNEHLEPIFKIFLSGLEETEIDYWVYGGIAIAAVAGKFIRKNDDVDIFVKEADIDSARSILESRCYDQGLVWNECQPFEKGGFSRRKLEVRKNQSRKEILSVVPVFLETNEATLVFRNGVKKYPLDILERVKREISGNVFYSPSDSYIRKIFKDTFQGKSNWRNRNEIIEDARVVLTPDEFRQCFGSN